MAPQVNFIGNRPITWEPVSSTESSPSQSTTNPRANDPTTSQLPSPNEDLRHEFAAFLRSKIQKLDPKEKRDRDRIKIFNCLLGVVNDPTSTLRILDPELLRSDIKQLNLRDVQHAFQRFHDNNNAKIADIAELWCLSSQHDARSSSSNASDAREDGRDVNNDQTKVAAGSKSPRPEATPNAPLGSTKRPKLPESPVDTSELSVDTPTLPATTSSPSKGRGNAEKAAQAKMVDLYKRCVLTNSEILVEGAHIIDVRVIARLREKESTPLEIWDTLQIFWPLKLLQSLETTSREKQNILPLRVDTRWYWDKHRFALRPVEHPTDPAHRLYLQMVWLKDITERNNLVKSPYNHKNGTITDSRRGVEVDGDFLVPAIKHGDVYELVVEEEKELPCIDFLRLRFAVQKLLAGMIAAGALKDFFKGPPPPPLTCPARDEKYMPGDWEMIICAAEEEGVLSAEAAMRWRRQIMEECYQEDQEMDEDDVDWRHRSIAQWDSEGQGS